MSKKVNRKFISVIVTDGNPGRTYGQLVKEVINDEEIKVGTTSMINHGDYEMTLTNLETENYKHIDPKNNQIIIEAFDSDNKVDHDQIKLGLLSLLTKDNIDIIVDEIHSNKKNNMISFLTEDGILLEVFFRMKYRKDLDRK